MAKVGKLAEKSPWDGRKIEFYTFPKIIPKFLSKNAIKSQFFNWGVATNSRCSEYCFQRAIAEKSLNSRIYSCGPGLELRVMRCSQGDLR